MKVTSTLLGKVTKKNISCKNNRKRQRLHLKSYGKKKIRFDFPQVGRAEEMLYDHCYVSNDFMNDLHQWGDADFYHNNVHKMQLPYTPVPKAPPVDPEILRQRRQELAKRLVEINAKKREEKVIGIQLFLKHFDQFMFGKLLAHFCRVIFELIIRSFLI